MTDQALGAVREDRFLDGSVRLIQPLEGYRAATDPVLLAAAVPARAGQTVLDLGCGAGAASFCLAARVEVGLTGLDIQPQYLDLAARNAQVNGARMVLFQGDVAAPPGPLKALSFDHVMLNPPYHPADHLASPVTAKDRAHRAATPLDAWLATGLARLKPGGWLTLIHRAERLSDILAGLGGTGDIAIKPLAARQGRDAKRVIVKARKGSKAPLRLCPPLVLHAGVAHTGDQDDFTETARAILRAGAALEF